MEVQTFWLIILFIFCFFGYLSFSLISYSAFASMDLSADRRKQEYDLAPLSKLYDERETFLSILSFCRLLFVIPLLILAYQWSHKTGTLAEIAGLISLTFLLYLLPQWLFRNTPISYFRRTAQIIAYVFYPVFWLFARLSPKKIEQVESTEEKKSLTNGEQEEVESEEFKGDLLEAISTIGETTVREVMTPRVDMVAISSDVTLQEVHQMFKEHKFSRLPVYKEKVDNIIGVVSVMDLLSRLPDTDLTAPVTGIMRSAVYVPETKKVFTLMREFRESHAQMAIVIDEYGGTSGVVTLEDLLEEIVGEIEDEYDEAPYQSVQEKEDTYIVSGNFPVEQLEDIFKMEIKAEDFETISGLIFSTLGRIPIVGEIVKYKNLTMEIIEADKRRIHRVRIKETPQEENAEEEVL